MLGLCMRQNAADATAKLDRDADVRPRSDALDEWAECKARLWGWGCTVAPVRVEVRRQMLEQPRVREVVGAVLHEERRDVGRQLAFDDGRDFRAQVVPGILEHDRHSVDDRIAAAAIAHEHLAYVVERTHVEPIAMQRAAARTHQQIQPHSDVASRFHPM